MKKIYLSLLMLAAFSFSSKAQVDLSIGNLDAGFDYDEKSGIIHDIYFTMLSNENKGASNFKIGIYFAPLNAQSLEDCILLESTDAPSISGNSSRDVDGWTINLNELSDVPPNGTYRLLVSIDIEDDVDETDEDNNSLYLSEQGSNLKFTAAGGPTSVAKLATNLMTFTCFPNPVVKTTTLGFNLSQAGSVALKLYDATGKEVMVVLESNTILAAGKNEVAVNMANLPNGVYFFILQSNEGVITQKIVKQ